MQTRTISLLGSGAPALLLACSASSGGSAPAAVSSDWNCAQAAVPYGSAVECTATASSALSASYVCTTGDSCPPPAVDAGPPPTCDTTGSCVDYDAGGPVAQGGAQVDSGSGGSCSCTDDAGQGVGKGNGNGNGNGGNGNGGTGNGGGNGNGGNPHYDAGMSGAPSGASDAGCAGYSSGGSDGTWQCSSDGINVTCEQPPTCTPATHPSACGACVPDDMCDDDCVPPSAGGCWVTGGGFIPDATGDQDSFGGNAMPMKSGTVRGEWEDVDDGNGNKAHGEAQYLYCRHVSGPGPGQPSGPSHNFDINQVYFGGPARWFVGGTWNDGYWFDVMAEDHGEGKGQNAGGPDFYHFTIRQISGTGVSGPVVYDTENSLGGGNIQIHPANNGHPYTSSALPPWVSLQP